jgi:hypothetical protein
MTRARRSASGARGRVGARALAPGATRAGGVALWVGAVLVGGFGWFALLRWLGDAEPLRAEPAATSSIPTAAVPDSWRIAPSSQQAVPGAQAAVELQGPEAVEGGSEFSLTVRIGAAAGGRGWLDLVFDPAILTLADASVRHHAHGPGIVRLFFDEAFDAPGAAPREARLQFVTGFSAPGPTIVRIGTGESVSAGGRPVGLGTLPSAQIFVLTP